MSFSDLKTRYPKLMITFEEEGYNKIRSCIGTIVKAVSYERCWDTDVNEPMGELDGELEIVFQDKSIIRLTICHYNGIVVYGDHLHTASFDGLEWRRVWLHEPSPWKDCVGHKVVQIDVLLNPKADCAMFATSGIKFVLDNGLSIGYDHLVLDSPRISLNPDWSDHRVFTIPYNT